MTSWWGCRGAGREGRCPYSQSSVTSLLMHHMQRTAELDSAVGADLLQASSARDQWYAPCFCNSPIMPSAWASAAVISGKTLPSTVIFKIPFIAWIVKKI